MRAATDTEPEPGLGLAVLVGQRRDAHVASVRPAAAADPGGGGDGLLAPRVGVVGVVDADAWVAGERLALELHRQVDLAIGLVLGEGLVPQLLVGDRHAVRFGETGPLVDGSELDVVARLGDDIVDRRGFERAGVGEPGAAVADDAHADALALGADELLDAPLVHPDRRLATPRDERLELLARLRPLDDPCAQPLQLGQRLAHAAALRPEITFSTTKVMQK